MNHRIIIQSLLPPHCFTENNAIARELFDLVDCEAYINPGILRLLVISNWYWFFLTLSTYRTSAETPFSPRMCYRPFPIGLSKCQVLILYNPPSPFFGFHSVPPYHQLIHIQAMLDPKPWSGGPDAPQIPYWVYFAEKMNFVGHSTDAILHDTSITHPPIRVLLVF